MLDSSMLIVQNLLDGLEDKMSKEELSECPICASDFHTRHESCEEYIDDCICPLEELEQESVYFCENCNIRFDPYGGWMKDMDDHGKTSDLPSLLEDENAELQLFENDLFSNDKSYWDGSSFKGAISPIKPTKNVQPPLAKCRHKHHEVILHDGTSIYCSSVNQTLDANEEQIVPDFGLYADHSWRPTWRNEFIDWPDMRIPNDRETSLQQIWEGYCRAAENDEFVEIGCIGGHGRTGVILAGMYLGSADGKVTAKEAIDFVRKEYCASAIETPKQEWFVNYISHIWFGEILEDEPEDNSYTSTGTTCKIADHYAMMMRGWKHCILRKGCQYWNLDLKTFSQEPKDGDIKDALERMHSYSLRPGGIVLEADKKKTCSPLYHYAMIANGHSHCIILGEDCNSWDNHHKEFVDKNSINGINALNTDHINALNTDYMKELVEEFPTVEEWKGIQHGEDPF